jgi:acyl-[acyl carrier protein]--UDP-N-acetylglucosamine O-acyltransferase
MAEFTAIGAHAVNGSKSLVGSKIPIFFIGFGGERASASSSFS